MVNGDSNCREVYSKAEPLFTYDWPGLKSLYGYEATGGGMYLTLRSSRSVKGKS